MKKFLSTLLAVILIIIMAACETSSEVTVIESDTNYEISEKLTPIEYYAHNLRSFSDEVMPIGGFIGPTDLYIKNGYKYPSLINDEVFGALSEAGVNFIIDMKNDFAVSPQNAAAVLELGEKYDISFFLKNSAVMNFADTVSATSYADVEQMRQQLELMYEYSSFAGVYGRDEPTAAFFPKMKNAITNYDTAAAQVGEDLSSYWNLLPYVSGTHLSGTSTSMTYAQYLQGFAAANPPFIMYDTYPFTGLEGSIGASWFTLMNEIRDFADSQGKSWWLFIQAGGYFDGHSQHRMPTEGEFHWNINTALALGAKGIAYFPLVEPPEWINFDIANKNSLINQFGAKTQYYFYAQKANNQIAAIDHVLMKSRNMGAIVTGNSPAILRDNTLSNFRQLKSVSGSPSLVGCFDCNGGTALYVVNNSTAETAAEITLNFDKKYGYEVIQRGIKAEIAAKSFTLKLDAGEGALVVLK